jgi:hypothetical protein
MTSNPARRAAASSEGTITLGIELDEIDCQTANRRLTPNRQSQHE